MFHLIIDNLNVVSVNPSDMSLGVWEDAHASLNGKFICPIGHPECNLVTSHIGLIVKFEIDTRFISYLFKPI